MTARPLTAEEARVLAVLFEKQYTVPDSYPLSLNALTAGCNQKSAREPLMQLSDTDVLQAIEGLKALSLVHEVSGSRVTRFDHNMPRGLGVPTQGAALLAMLMLRGPQTAAELRLHTERLHRFADISSVEAFLDELAERQPPRVRRLPRAPGAREARWAHLLCGEPPAVALTSPPAASAVAATWAIAPASAAGAGGGPSAAAGEIAALQAEQARLSAEVARLRVLVLRLAVELGVPADALAEAAPEHQGRPDEAGG